MTIQSFLFAIDRISTTVGKAAAWLLIALAVTLHLVAVLRLGGLPLARSMASVQLRPGDLPGNWFDQIRRSFKVKS